LEDAATTPLSSPIPYATEQGIISADQGIYSREQGIIDDW
jgi:hypothetical protein